MADVDNGGFLQLYCVTAHNSPILPSEPAYAASFCDFSCWTGRLRELGGELNNRPDWVAIPVRGLVELLDLS